MFAIFHTCKDFFPKWLSWRCSYLDALQRQRERKLSSLYTLINIPWVLTNSVKPHFSSQPSLGWRAQHRNALPLPVQLLPPPQGPGSVSMKWSGTEVGQRGDGLCCGWNYNIYNSEKLKAVHLALCIYLQKGIKAIKFKYSLLLERTVLISVFMVSWN